MFDAVAWVQESFSCSKFFQKSSGVFASGKRHDSPMTAIGCIYFMISDFAGAFLSHSANEIIYLSFAEYYKQTTLEL
jgi:hypothetical protein